MQTISENLNYKCPECGGTLIFKEEECYCKQCGLVIDDYETS